MANDINPAFADFNRVTVSQTRNYIAPDTKGVLEVRNIEYRDGHQGKSLIFTFRVVDCEALVPGGSKHSVGEEVCEVKKIDRSGRAGDTMRAAAITTLCRIAGYERPPEPSTFAKLLTEATSSEQPYCGYRVGYVNAKRDDGRAFPTYLALGAQNSKEAVAERR